MIVLPEKQNFLMIPKEVSSLEKSKIVILSAPYEASVSYGKGTKNGPRKIIESSHYVEFYDEEIDTELCFKHGIATIKELNFGKRKNKDAIDFLYKNVKTLLEKNKFCVTLGGEHSISTAPIKAHFEKYKNLSVLHFDAHSDLREEYQNNPYSHASVMARVCEFLNPQNLVQVGIRAQSIEESKFIKSKKVKTFYAYEIKTGKYGNNWQKLVARHLTNNVYISFDVDYFDPSIMPSTGTPEPNGFQWEETMNIFREMKKLNKRIVGFDVVELAPQKGVTHADYLAAKLTYKLLNFAFSK